MHVSAFIQRPKRTAEPIRPASNSTPVVRGSLSQRADKRTVNQSAGSGSSYSLRLAVRELVFVVVDVLGCALTRVSVSVAVAAVIVVVLVVALPVTSIAVPAAVTARCS